MQSSFVINWWMDYLRQKQDVFIKTMSTTTSNAIDIN